MSDDKREFEQLPEWLKDCWKLAPAIARKAEKYIEGIKPLSSDAVLGEVLQIIDSLKKDDFIYNIPPMMRTNHMMFENGWNGSLDELKKKILSIST